MSRYLIEKDTGKYIDEIESVDVCRWRIDDICCNDECDELADYPYPREKCYKNFERRCKFFKEEKEC